MLVMQVEVVWTGTDLSRCRWCVRSMVSVTVSWLNHTMPQRLTVASVAKRREST